jgi:hypothetical protein
MLSGIMWAFQGKGERQEDHEGGNI